MTSGIRAVPSSAMGDLADVQLKMIEDLRQFRLEIKDTFTHFQAQREADMAVLHSKLDDLLIAIKELYGPSEPISMAADKIPGPIDSNPGSKAVYSSENDEQNEACYVLDKMIDLVPTGLPSFSPIYSSEDEALFLVLEDLKWLFKENDQSFQLKIESVKTAHHVFDETLKLFSVDPDEEIHGNGDPLYSFSCILNPKSDADKRNWDFGMPVLAYNNSTSEVTCRLFDPGGVRNSSLQLVGEAIGVIFMFPADVLEDCVSNFGIVKVKKWLNIVKITDQVLFNSERSLCGLIFEVLVIVDSHNGKMIPVAEIAHRQNKKVTSVEMKLQDARIYTCNGPKQLDSNVAVVPVFAAGVSCTVLELFVWDPGKCTIFVYILEDKNVFKRVGKGLILIDTKLMIMGCVKGWFDCNKSMISMIRPSDVVDVTTGEPDDSLSGKIDPKSFSDDGASRNRPLELEERLISKSKKNKVRDANTTDIEHVPTELRVTKRLCLLEESFGLNLSDYVVYDQHKTKESRAAYMPLLNQQWNRGAVDQPVLIGKLITNYQGVDRLLIIVLICLWQLDRDDYGRDAFSFGNRQIHVNGDDREWPVLSNIRSSSTTELHPKATTLLETKPTAMPPTSVMTRLILIMVWRKLTRNPNTYSSFLGLAWSLVCFRWNVQMPAIVAKSIAILYDAGLGMAMFTIGLFMALQLRLIAGWKRVAVFSVSVRFLIGPAVMAGASFAVGLRGVLLKVAIIQAALPQGVVTFVFAKEYGVIPDIISTGVMFGMLVALPITLVYYFLLAFEVSASSTKGK